MKATQTIHNLYILIIARTNENPVTTPTLSDAPANSLTNEQNEIIIMAK